MDTSPAPVSPYPDQLLSFLIEVAIETLADHLLADQPLPDKAVELLFEITTLYEFRLNAFKDHPDQAAVHDHFCRSVINITNLIVELGGIFYAPWTITPRPKQPLAA